MSDPLAMLTLIYLMLLIAGCFILAGVIFITILLATARRL